MLCKLTKEEAAVVNALSDQAFNLFSGAMGTAGALIGMTSIPDCHKTSALVHAALNIAVMTALKHRLSHGEMTDINGLDTLKKRPEEFKMLIEDLNEIFAGVLRSIDPGHDYMINFFKMESKSVDSHRKEGEEGQQP